VEEEGKGKVMGRGICLLLNLDLATPLIKSKTATVNYLKFIVVLLYVFIL